MTTPISTSVMLAELRITFPALWTRPLREHGDSFADMAGVWTGEDVGHLMQDGLPIFFGLANGEPPYDGTVHEAFIGWLARRGWHCERHDGDVYFLLPGGAA